jgi:hypothetical protein
MTLTFEDTNASQMRVLRDGVEVAKCNRMRFKLKGVATTIWRARLDNSVVETHNISDAEIRDLTGSSKAEMRRVLGDFFVRINEVVLEA